MLGITGSDETELDKYMDEGGVAYFEAFNVEKSGQTYRVGSATIWQVMLIHNALDDINKDLQRYLIPEKDADIASFVSVAFSN
ncbi:MAG: hypothetical protein PHU14_11480 [Methylovulum sp.]|nr:hypothetical protein [Methylovulum sp.]